MSKKNRFQLIMAVIAAIAAILLIYNQLVLKPQRIQEQLWEEAAWINTRMDIFIGAEDNLPLLPDDHPLRAELEKEMEQSVRDVINTARNGEGVEKEYAAWLLREAMKAGPKQWENSFALWIARRGKVLGVEQCYHISMRVCIDMNFSILEAEELMGSKDLHSDS